MRTEQIKIYKFEELSKEAQERAKEIVLNNYHEFSDFSDRCEDIIEIICGDIKEKTGLEFQYKDFDWDLEYRGRLNFEDTDRLANELIGKYEKNLKVGAIEGLNIFWNHNDRFELDNIYWDDWDDGESEIDPLVRLAIERNIKEDLSILEDLLRQGLKWLKEEYEYTLSEEFAIDEIEARELEFDEEGNIW